MINSTKVFLDLHDAIDKSWLSDVVESRLSDVVDSNIQIMTKSLFHSRILNLTNSAIIIPNGISSEYDSGSSVLKQKNMMICTSSPDRCLRALLRALPIIRKEIPDAEIHWAYGFTSGVSKGGLEADSRKEVQDWVSESKRLIKETKGFVDLGRLSQKDILKEYQKASLFVYGTNFPEIDCISLTKAMACNCIPVVTPSGAMHEKLVKACFISENTKECSELFSKDYMDTSLKEGPEFDAWVSEIIKTLKRERLPQVNDEQSSLDKWIKDPVNSTFFSSETSSDTYDVYSWKNVSSKWISFF
jgi:glycosyltransferase involved in cell wall biosynthesis